MISLYSGRPGLEPAAYYPIKILLLFLPYLTKLAV